MDFASLGRMFFNARFGLEVGLEGIARNEHIPDEEVEECTEVLDDAAEKFKMISNTLAQASAEFRAGYAAADREATEAGRQWTEQRREKIALLRLAGDDTPEAEIPV